MLLAASCFDWPPLAPFGTLWHPLAPRRRWPRVGLGAGWGRMGRRKSWAGATRTGLAVG